ncbi:MAG: protein translocase subunit SecD [FCB group bacterium]|jgi:SecD/SecF fusion protein|nr:protein translocase subunit SecD [FCB group bacterium]
MQKHTIRTVAIWFTIILAVIWIYPTVGWNMLTAEQKEARKAQWEAEDAEYTKPGMFKDTAKSLRRWWEFDNNRIINLGLDLQGGIHMVLGLETDKLTDADWERLGNQFGLADRDDIEQHLQDVALQTVRRRVAEFEAQEPLITAMGSNQIQVQLPGEKDIKRAQNLIMKTAYLTFNIVAGEQETSKIYAAIEQRFPRRFLPFMKTYRGSVVVPEENIERIRQVVKEAQEVPGLIPETKKILIGQAPNKLETLRQHEIYLVEKEPIMTGEGLSMAVARPDEQSPSQWKILFGWNAESATQFAKATQANIGKGMAIVLDDVAVSAPVIRSQIGASGEITGSFTREQALDLAIALNSGAMPVPVKEDYSGYVGASLGSDSVRAGVWSAIIGIALVIIITLAYYRIPGLIADIGLFLNALMLLGLMAYLHATLTLPGIAGLILTIGMAVDANVLVFERMREERRNGRSLLATIDLGYSRAATTVIDSNVTTLIAGLVLMQFGTGPVQGFAVTLCIGIVTSVYTALIVTRAMFDFLTRHNLLSDVKMNSVIPAVTNFKFMDKRYYCAIFSAILIVVGMGWFTYREINGPSNFGVDFTTGTNVVVRLDNDQPVQVGALRDALGAAKFPDVRVQEYTTEQAEGVNNRFLVHVSSEEEDAAPAATPAPAGEVVQPLSAQIVEKIQTALLPIVGNDAAKVNVESVETVGAAVGKRLIIDAILAVFYSMFFITLYLWFRYELRFALGGILALFHDVLITVGLFALTGRQINMGVVAAILTVIGYSLNDTVVVFDRIREDMRLYRGRGMGLLEIMNLAINETLSRTTMTSGLTLVVVIVLYFFGGEVLRDFAFALIVGIVFGTYSSIFVASPLAYFLQRFQSKKKATITDKIEPGSRHRPKRQKPSDSEGEVTV